MYNPILIARVTSKENPKLFRDIYVMEMKYKISDNVIWITDHRGSIWDFDLYDFSVEIKMK